MKLGAIIRDLFGHQDPHEDGAPRLHPLIGRTARYTLIGGLCALANNAVMILGDLAGGHYVPMTLLAFLTVTPLGYVLHANFTFREPRSFTGLLRFASGGLLGLALALFIMAVLCTGLGLPVVIAAPIATILLILWNYAAAHWAIIGRLRFH